MVDLRSSFLLPAAKSRSANKPEQSRKAVPYLHTSSVSDSAKGNAPGQAGRGALSGLSAESAAAPPTVLLVSDDDYFRSTMRAYLDDEGLRVRSCGDAARIPELFFNGSGPRAADRDSQVPTVELLLIDVHALGATGLRLAAELTGFQPHLPVIVISASDAESNQFRLLGGRDWRFLQKPVVLPRLLGLIHNLLEPRRRMRSARPVSSASGARAGNPEGSTRESPALLAKPQGGAQ